MRDHPLSRATQVLEVLRAGGYIIQTCRPGVEGYGLCDLYTAAGQLVPAWQQAVTSNMNRLRKEFEVQAHGDNMARWGLRA